MSVSSPTFIYSPIPLHQCQIEQNDSSLTSYHGVPISPSPISRHSHPTPMSAYYGKGSSLCPPPFSPLPPHIQSIMSGKEDPNIPFKGPIKKTDKKDDLKNINQTHLAGSFVGPYLIENTLGQGSYGKVKLALHYVTREKVALKFINKNNIKKESHLVRIRREIRLLKLLNHPHIIKLYEVIETESDIILVMEHASGGELLDHIQTSGRLDESQARAIFVQILSAVQYIHLNALIHRDLKPQNLLFANPHKNVLKLVDFGFSNLYEPSMDDDGSSISSLLGTFCGSPYYASPEMISGTKYKGPEVDIWSLGVILYSIVTGSVPFNDENIKGLYAKILACQYMMPQTLSPALQDLIRGMLRTDRQSRLTLEDVVQHAWMKSSSSWARQELNVNPTNKLVKDIQTRPLIQSSQQLDSTLLSKLADYNIDSTTAHLEIFNNPQGKVATLYWLLSDYKVKRDQLLNENNANFDSNLPHLWRLNKTIYDNYYHYQQLRRSGSSLQCSSTNPVNEPIEGKRSRNWLPFHPSPSQHGRYKPSINRSSYPLSVNAHGFAVPERILNEDETVPLLRFEEYHHFYSSLQCWSSPPQLAENDISSLTMREAEKDPSYDYNIVRPMDNMLLYNNEQIHASPYLGGPPQLNSLVHNRLQRYATDPTHPIPPLLMALSKESSPSSASFSLHSNHGHHHSQHHKTSPFHWLFSKWKNGSSGKSSRRESKKIHP